jgi:hypothetical protein
MFIGAMIVATGIILWTEPGAVRVLLGIPTALAMGFGAHMIKQYAFGETDD